MKRKNIWKWIIGIVLGLIVLAALVGVGFLVRTNFHVTQFAAVANQDWNTRGPGMMPFGGPGWHMRGPSMMGYSGMMPFGGLFSGLISLGLLALIVLGIVWLVRNLRVSKAVAVHPCTRCGKPVQVDWKNCPYCGKAL